MVQSASLHSLAHELVPGLEGPTLEVVSNSVFLLARPWASPEQGRMTVYGVGAPGPPDIVQKAADYLRYDLAPGQVDKNH